MGLKDLIAQSGAKNFETMRKGWLPTIEERQSRRMKDLQIQSAEGTLAYEPERQRLKRRKSDTDEKRNQAVIKRTEQVIDQADTKQKWDKTKLDFATTSRLVKGAFNVYSETENISDAKNIIRQNYDAIIEAGDEGSDKAVDRFLSDDISDEEAASLLTGLHSVLPSVQDKMDKADLYKSRRTGSTRLERFLENSNMTDDEKEEVRNLSMDKDSGKISQEQFDKRLADKQATARNKGTIALGKEYKTEFKPFIHTANQITKIKNALRSGDNAAMDIQVTNMLTNIEGSGIKAKSMFDIHNAPLGNIMERIKDEVGRFVGGVKTDFQKNEILSAVTDLEKYNNLVLGDGKSKYRSMARKNKYDIGLTIPFDSFKEVQDYYKAGHWTKDEAVEYMKQNPRLLKTR